MLLAGCSGGLPLPRPARLATEDFEPVPFAPKPPPIEYVPKRPDPRAVFVDGSWRWQNRRYEWNRGGWMIVPFNVYYARWQLMRREADGQLFFSRSRWKTASGANVTDVSFEGALGEAARATLRLGTDGAPAKRGAEQAQSIDTGDDP